MAAPTPRRAPLLSTLASRKRGAEELEESALENGAKRMVGPALSNRSEAARGVPEQSGGPRATPSEASATGDGPAPKRARGGESASGDQSSHAVPWHGVRLLRAAHGAFVAFNHTNKRFQALSAEELAKLPANAPAFLVSFSPNHSETGSKPAAASVSLQNMAGRYLCVEQGQLKFAVDRYDFTCVEARGGLVALVSREGKFLSAKKDSKAVTCRMSKEGPSERFAFVDPAALQQGASSHIEQGEHAQLPASSEALRTLDGLSHHVVLRMRAQDNRVKAMAQRAAAAARSQDHALPVPIMFRDSEERNRCSSVERAGLMELSARAPVFKGLLDDFARRCESLGRQLRSLGDGRDGRLATRHAPQRASWPSEAELQLDLDDAPHLCSLDEAVDACDDSSAPPRAPVEVEAPLFAPQWEDWHEEMFVRLLAEPGAAEAATIVPMEPSLVDRVLHALTLKL